MWSFLRAALQDFRRKHYKYHSPVTSSRPRTEISPKFPKVRELLERVMTHVEVLYLQA